MNDHDTNKSRGNDNRPAKISNCDLLLRCCKDNFDVGFSVDGMLCSRARYRRI